jgi:hypothetical protein
MAGLPATSTSDSDESHEPTREPNWRSEQAEVSCVAAMIEIIRLPGLSGRQWLALGIEAEELYSTSVRLAQII